MYKRCQNISTVFLFCFVSVVLLFKDRVLEYRLRINVYVYFNVIGYLIIDIINFYILHYNAGPHKNIFSVLLLSDHKHSIYLSHKSLNQMQTCTTVHYVFRKFF